MRYAITAATSNRGLFVLTRDGVQLGLHGSIEAAIHDALQQLRGDVKRGGDARLFVNGVEVIVRCEAAALAA